MRNDTVVGRSLSLITKLIPSSKHNNKLFGIRKLNQEALDEEQYRLLHIHQFILYVICLWKCRIGSSKQQLLPSQGEFEE